MLKTRKSITTLKSLRATGMKAANVKSDDCSEEMLVLFAVATATNCSLNAHVPLQAILSKFKKEKRGTVRKTIKNLAKMGCVSRHPTRGGLTWHLTKFGAETLTHESDTHGQTLHILK